LPVFCLTPIISKARLSGPLCLKKIIGANHAKVPDRGCWSVSQRGHFLLDAFPGGKTLLPAAASSPWPLLLAPDKTPPDLRVRIAPDGNIIKRKKAKCQDNNVKVIL